MVLVIEDDESLRTQLKWALAGDYELVMARDRASALEAYRERRPDLTLLDLCLPPQPNDPAEGLALLAALRRLDYLAKVIVLSGKADRRIAQQVVSEGAWDYVVKPVDMTELKLLLRRCHQLAAMEREYLESQRESSQGYFEGMLGMSPAMEAIFASLQRVATTEAPVLILGESGTGRGMAAKAIHQRSLHREGPFLTVHCSAIPEANIEANLFGIEPGAAGGHAVPTIGRIEQAAGGTLFLGEVNALPLSSQVKLLRFLEEGVIERVGGHSPVEVSTRIVAAAGPDLPQALADGRFRDDLYYHLAVVAIRIPPLRERRADIRMLAETFLKRFGAEYGRKGLDFDAEALRTLDQHAWPGNVRELENRVRGAVIMAEGNVLRAQDLELPLAVSAGLATGGLREARQIAERELIVQALQKHRGKIAPAAAELGISRPTFYALMQRLGIKRHPESPSESFASS